MSYIIIIICISREIVVDSDVARNVVQETQDSNIRSAYFLFKFLSLPGNFTITTSVTPFIYLHCASGPRQHGRIRTCPDFWYNV